MAAEALQSAMTSRQMAAPGLAQSSLALPAGQAESGHVPCQRAARHGQPPRDERIARDEGVGGARRGEDHERTA